MKIILFKKLISTLFYFAVIYNAAANVPNPIVTLNNPVKTLFSISVAPPTVSIKPFYKNKDKKL